MILSHRLDYKDHTYIIHCSCCCCYYVKVKSTPSLDLALGVWQKYVGPTRVKGDGKVGSCHSIEFYHLYKFSVAIVTKKIPRFLMLWKVWK